MFSVRLMIVDQMLTFESQNTHRASENFMYFCFLENSRSCAKMFLRRFATRATAETKHTTQLVNAKSCAEAWPETYSAGSKHILSCTADEGNIEDQLLKVAQETQKTWLLRQVYSTVRGPDDN
jgi:hypothetical protein